MMWVSRMQVIKLLQALEVCMLSKKMDTPETFRIYFFVCVVVNFNCMRTKLN